MLYFLKWRYRTLALGWIEHAIETIQVGWDDEVSHVWRSISKLCVAEPELDIRIQNYIRRNKSISSHKLSLLRLFVWLILRSKVSHGFAHISR